MSNPFFINQGPFNILEILKLLSINSNNFQKRNVHDVKDLLNASNNDLTFFHSKKYKELANLTKAAFCITTDSLKIELPKNCKPLIVKDVLISTSIVTSKFYPDSVNDKFDSDITDISDTTYKNKIIFGKNVLIGKNVTLGSNCSIGHNTIIEKNVVIGDNCSVGSNTIIRNSLIGNDVKILDNCIIGKHGFGFFPNSSKNIRYPHIGFVKIEDNCEIGSSSTIDLSLIHI